MTSNKILRGRGDAAFSHDLNTVVLPFLTQISHCTIFLYKIVKIVKKDWIFLGGNPIHKQNLDHVQPTGGNSPRLRGIHFCILKHNPQEKKCHKKRHRWERKPTPRQHRGGRGTRKTNEETKCSETAPKRKCYPGISLTINTPEGGVADAALPGGPELGVDHIGVGGAEGRGGWHRGVEGGPHAPDVGSGRRGGGAPSGPLLRKRKSPPSQK